MSGSGLDAAIESRIKFHNDLASLNRKLVDGLISRYQTRSRLIRQIIAAELGVVDGGEIVTGSSVGRDIDGEFGAGYRHIGPQPEESGADRGFSFATHSEGSGI